MKDKELIQWLKAKGFGHEHFFNDKAAPYTFLMHKQSFNRVRVYENGRIFVDGERVTQQQLMERFNQ